MHKLVLYSLCILLTACAAAPDRPAYRQSSQSVKSDNTAKDLLHIARQQLGISYRYGGSKPSQGFDCSGLVYYAHRQTGVRVPRSTRAQYGASRPVALNAIRPGDLLFFRINSDQADHVGIYTGSRSFIHAPSSGKTVTQSSLDNPYWQRTLFAAGRF